MVFAASTLRIPAALTEADAHLGLANRLAAPFAKRLFLAYPLETRWRRSTRVVGRPIPRGAGGVRRRRRARSSSCRRRARCSVVFGALAGAKALNELVVDTWGASGPAILHQTGARDYELVSAASTRPDYRVIAETDRFGAALTACDLVLARSGRRCGRSPPPGRPAVLVPYPFATGDHQALNAQHFVQAGGAIMVRELELDDVPELVRSLLDDPPRLRRMGEAMLRAARPGAADAIADELARARPDDRPPAVVRRDRRRGPLGVRAARAGVGRRGRRLGSRRDAVPRAARRRADRDLARAASSPTAGRRSSRRRTRTFPACARKEFLRELVAARPSIAVAGTHGKGTTAAMIAFVLRETGRDPAWLIGAPVPQLGSNAGFGGGLPRGRGGRVGSHRVRARAGDRCRHEPRARPPHRVRLGGGARAASSTQWLAGVPHVVRDAPPFDGELAVPGAHNRLNAGAALAALELAGVARADAAPALARFTGTGRRFEIHESGVADGRRRLRPSPDGGRRGDRRRARALSRTPRARALPAASLFAHPASRGASSPMRSRPPTTSRSRTSMRRVKSRSRA